MQKQSKRIYRAANPATEAPSLVEIVAEIISSTLEEDVAFFNRPHMKTLESDERYYWSKSEIDYITSHVDSSKIVVEKICDPDLDRPYWKVVPVVIPQGPNAVTLRKMNRN